MTSKYQLPIVLLSTALVACPANDPNGEDEVGESSDDASEDDATEGDGDETADTTGEGDDDPDDTTGDGDGEGDDDTTTGDGDGDPLVDACEFAASANDWPLPQEFVGADVYQQLTDYWSCNGGGEYRYQLLDMTGDGAVDFLVTDDCDEAGAGTTHWKVFTNTGDGFAAQAIDWSLPQVLVGSNDLHQQITDYWGCNNGETYRYQLLDLTGDGAVDFLVTDSCDAAGVGTSSWHVYENTGSGFAAQPINWPLPQYLGTNERYEQIVDYWTCPNNEMFRYQLIDMTGDGAVDFLVTDACDATGVGADNWLVHENTGAGFANGTIQWALPQVFPGDNEIYEQITDYWPCTGGEYRYQLLDLTGDGGVDFLITDACDETGIGASAWQVLENTGTGFANPIEWPLPTPLGDAELYEQTADYWPCAGETYRFQTLDLTGDHAPDLVVSDACDTAGAGTERWDVFKNVGTAFADAPIEWALPQLLNGTDLYEQLTDYWGCNGEEYRYSVLDITGDGAPDMLATDLCDANGTGTTHWTVFEAVCE
jgi:hypothetical protein